ncbi:histidine phosphatase superfamily [Mycena floridula]|nr:histidine phosphatase superfamily [Mycena floridula]
MTIGLSPILSFFLHLLFVLAVNTSVPLESSAPELDYIPPMPLGLTKGNSSLYRPYQPQLDVDNYPEPPIGLKLEQAHVFVRHGERTPVGVRLAGPPANVPEHWLLCNAARDFKTLVAGSGQPGSEAETQLLSTRRLVERADGTAIPGQCLLGELTDLGRKSTLNYGQALRKLYVEKLHLIPDVLQNTDAVYFRSTNMPRTIESLNQVMQGLYPTSKCHPSAVPAYIVRNGKDENLLGNTYTCKRLEILQIGFAQAAAAAYNHTLEHLDRKLSKYLGGNPIRVDGKPRASGVLDTVRAAIAHDIKVPPEFEDPAVVDIIERAVVTEWFAGYKTEEVRRLGMGRMLDDLARKMQNKVDKGDRDPLKLLVHSTHDTALAALCQTLDVFDEKWPAFTASLTFELFKKVHPEEYTTTHDEYKTSRPPSGIMQAVMSMSTLKPKPSPEYYIRMRYQNKNMVLPLCKDEGKHLPGSPEFCTLTAFTERVKELAPIDWDSECAPQGRA